MATAFRNGGSLASTRMQSSATPPDRGGPLHPIREADIAAEELRQAYTGFCRHKTCGLPTGGFGKACAEMFGPRIRLQANQSGAGSGNPRPWGYDVPSGMTLAGGGRCATRHQSRSAGYMFRVPGFCPTVPARRASGTAKVRGIWTFVSGVSLVPPYLELMDKYRNGEWRRQSRALTGAITSLPGQVGQVQQSRGFHDETERDGHTGHLRQSSQELWKLKDDQNENR